MTLVFPGHVRPLDGMAEPASAAKALRAGLVVSHEAWARTDSVRSLPAATSRGRGRALVMRAIKCLKGVRWMPGHAQAMKDVVRCEKPWGAANKL